MMLFAPMVSFPNVVRRNALLVEQRCRLLLPQQIGKLLIRGRDVASICRGATNNA
jgi:hypothetical protein